MTKVKIKFTETDLMRIAFAVETMIRSGFTVNITEGQWDKILNKIHLMRLRRIDYEE